MNWIKRMCRISGVATIMLLSISSAGFAEGLPRIAVQSEDKPKPAKPAVAVGATLDTNGRLWLAKVDNKRLLVSRSEDGGLRFPPFVVVTPQQENIEAAGENRPKIAIAKDGTVLLTWTQALAKSHTGNIRFSRSVDGGKNFSTPITLNDDGRITSHRFDSLAIDGIGNVVVTWLDARNSDAAKHEGKRFVGSSVYMAHSTNNGATFSANRSVTDHTCECCRTAMTWSSEGPVAFWRNLYDVNTRDFALAHLNLSGVGPPTVRRATDDDWQIDACPHHGGDIAAAAATLHLVWYTQGRTRQGLFYKNIKSGRESQPLPFGNASAQAAHAGVAAAGHTVLITWREFNGRNYAAMAMRSNDGGISWSAPQSLAESTGAADIPLPLTDARQSLVVWNSINEGVRVLPVAISPAAVAGK